MAEGVFEMGTIRPPAVAGQFYPGEAQRLKETVNNFIRDAKEISATRPKAIIVPHAGYLYSGPVAGTAYASFLKGTPPIKKVILLGPAHWAAVGGLAASSADAFATPLGNVSLDKKALDLVKKLPQFVVYDGAHQREHCLEVQLPFMQEVIKNFTVVPLVVGDATPGEVAEVLDQLWNGSETVIVVSSDLSHYQDYETATRIDKVTSAAIEALEQLGEGQACGRRAINGLLLVARRRGMTVKTVDLRNSGDTAGPRNRVVGYGAYLFFE